MSSSLPIVLDNGTGTLKSGYSGENEPRSILSTCIGRSTGTGFNNNKIYYNYENRGAVKWAYPIEYGYIKNWDDIQLLWSRIFENELKVESKNTPVFLTESTLNPIYNREKSVEIFFEKFNIPSLYIANSAFMSMFAAGKTTGVVVECGHGVSTVVSMYDGVSMPATSMRLNLGGKDVTEYLMRIFSNLHSYETMNTIKEKFGYIALDYDEELSKNASREFFELPDKQILSLGNDRFFAGEAFFKPSILSMNMPEEGVQKLLHQCVSKCDLSLRNDLYANVVLAGGSTQMKGFGERLKREISLLVGSGVNVNVSHPIDQHDPNANKPILHSSWVGGSIVSSLESFKSSWISNSEYDEVGPSIVHRKC